MLAKVSSSVISGLDASTVSVEVRCADARKPSFIIVGLGDTAIRESRERVSSAIIQAGYRLPKKIVVNLAPAEIKKEGSSFDLPIAVGILAASKQLSSTSLLDFSVHGELSLDGEVKPIRGAVALSVEANSTGLKNLVVPKKNSKEASLIQGNRVFGIASLGEAAAFLEGRKELEAEKSDPAELRSPHFPCFSEVNGQEFAKRAVLIAAAGGHNILLTGPPGCGKSMLASRIPGILPPLSKQEMFETARIHSVAGQAVEEIICGLRPFRAPHHGVSEAGLIGGGSVPRPGEISLAHNGVLFLDEFPEYRRGALESMRAPLENGTVQITRAKGAEIFPARFQLIAAMNPCPCGNGKSGRQKCRCSPGRVEQYLAKLSQPILDRIDLRVELEPVALSEMTHTKKNRVPAPSAELRKNVISARERAIIRQDKINHNLQAKEMNSEYGYSSDLLSFTRDAAEKLGLSARGYIRTLRVSRTIADLDNRKIISNEDVMEAMQYRAMEQR